MLDILEKFFGAFLGLLLYCGMLAVVLAWPVPLVYAVWRHLHYLRRIARALEVRAAGTAFETVGASNEHLNALDEARERILNSAFGR